MPLQSAYASAKHGLVGLLDSLRLELEHEGSTISVTNIIPGAINTPLFNKARTHLGVKPQGIPPYYQPEVVVDAILYAAENPVRELYAGGSARFLTVSQMVAPRFTDASLQRVAFRGQMSNEPKSAHDANNLFEPVEGYDHVYGDFGDQASRYSLYPRLQTMPRFTAVAGLALAALAVIVVRAYWNGRESQTLWEKVTTPVKNVADAGSRRLANSRRSRSSIWQWLAFIPLVEFFRNLRQRRSPSLWQRLSHSRPVQTITNFGHEPTLWQKVTNSQPVKSVSQMRLRQPKSVVERVSTAVKEMV
jgi:hypothetical protein